MSFWKNIDWLLEKCWSLIIRIMVISNFLLVCFGTENDCSLGEIVISGCFGGEIVVTGCGNNSDHQFIVVDIYCYWLVFGNNSDHWLTLINHRTIPDMGTFLVSRTRYKKPPSLVSNWADQEHTTEWCPLLILSEMPCLYSYTIDIQIWFKS